MLKKLLYMLLVLVLVVVLFLLFAKALTFKGLCGWTPASSSVMRMPSDPNSKAIAVLMKEWPCKCIGIKYYEVGDYSQNVYCTGINLSINRLVPYFVGRNSQYPVSVFENL